MFGSKKFFLRKLSYFVSDQKGASLVLVALSLVVLMGFAALCVDAGMLYKTRREMVAAADAGALAGAKELGDTGNEENSKNKAEEYAINNGASECVADVVDDTYDGKPVKVVKVIKALRNENYAFARVLGFDNKDVGARASALWLYPTKLWGGLPLYYEYSGGFPPPDPPFPDNDIVLRNKENGNWDLLDVGKGKVDVTKAFAGEPIPFKDVFDEVGDKFEGTTEPGKAVAIESGIEDRMKQYPDMPMYGYIVVVKEVEEAGKTKLEVLGFAAFLIKDVIKGFQKNDDGWYAVGSPWADFDEDNDPKIYGSGLDGSAPGYDKMTDASNAYPEASIIGCFLENVYIPASEVIEGNQDPNNDFSTKVVKLID